MHAHTRTGGVVGASRRVGIVLPGVLLLALAGCGAGGDDAPEEPAAQESADETEPAEPTEDDDGDDGEDDAADGAVMLGETSLGEVLVDAEGMTLYMFDPDEQGDSTCYDQCATAWPPLLADGEPTAGEGADQAMLGTTERTDGTTQVTYDGWPLYYFAQDAAAGDVAGQAVNDVWWVLGADGAPIRE